MYRVIDSIAGRRIAFLHAAPPLPLEAGIKFWPRLALVHMHIKQHKASHLCVTKDSDGIEVWRAGNGGGVSIASAIEVWLQQRAKTMPDARAAAEAETFMLVLPLDERIYFAKVEDGLVVSEQALVESRALEVVTQLAEDAAKLPLLALDTGANLCHLLKDILTLEELPFAVDAAHFEMAWLALLKRKMPHQMMLLPPLLLVAMVSLYLNLRPAQEVFDETINTIKPPVVVPEADFSAGVALGAIANVMQRSVMKYLAVAELKTLELKGRNLVLRGAATNFAPPKTMADSHGGLFKMVAGGWQVLLRDAFHERKGPLSSLSAIQIVEQIITATDSVLAKSDIASVSSDRGLKLIVIDVELDSPTPPQLRRLAKALAALPARLARAECGFSPWVATSCRMTLEVKTK